MQLSELRKKARRGAKPEADKAAESVAEAPVTTHAPTSSEDDEFLTPVPEPELAPSPSAQAHTPSLLESIGMVEAARIPVAEPVAYMPPPQAEAETGQTGLLEDLEQSTVDDDLVEYISFLAAGEPYVIRISRVKEIIRPRRLALVPRAPAYVRGILSLRGEMIPVLDLRRSLGLSVDRAVGSPLDSRIIVLAHNGAKLGLQVDRLEGVIRLDENLFRDPSEVQGSRDHRFLQAIGRFRGSFVIVLDVEEFFARGEK